MNKDEFRRAELPSGGANATAEGLATLAAFMANRGELLGQTLIKENSWMAMHDGITSSGLMGNKVMTHFSQGGVNRFQGDDFLSSGLRDSWWGWQGYGGAVFQWQPELRVGFAYIPTRLEWTDMTNRKGGMLQQEVVNCVEKLSQEPHESEQRVEQLGSVVSLQP